MKKIVFLAVLGIISFAIGTVGLYVAMPKLAPEVVDSTRVKLDSLGLISAPPRSGEAHETEMVDAVAADSAAGTDSSTAVSDTLDPSDSEIIDQLRDSLNTTTRLAQNLEKNNLTLQTQIEGLTKRLEKTEAKKVDASELSKSIAKLEDNELKKLLDGIELGVIETLYLQSSARDRTRLLQNMAPDRAAVFVRSLVKGTAPDAELAAKNSQQPVQDGPSNQ